MVQNIAFFTIVYTLCSYFNQFEIYIIADKDVCAPNHCQNGGSCIDAVNGYKCICIDGHIGDNCQTGMCMADLHIICLPTGLFFNHINVAFLH